jgi:hypothetical protein
MDRLGDLSWLGEAYNDQGWVQVGEAPPSPVVATKAQLEWDRAKKMLQESDWSMLPDVPMTAGDKAAWIEYRRGLREIRLQVGFPDSIEWPKGPK